MSFISYAQNYEDVMLWRALKHVENGFYIDVGAAWPNEHSVTKAFYERGWRGINVEPNPVHHASLIKQRPRDINLQLAVGESPGTLTMNLVGETGLSTLDTSIANQHQNGGWNITQQTVDIDTLASICSQHVPAGQEVHFLKIDIEGFEEQALKSNNWTSFRPWIVLVEATLPLTQQESYDNWEPILLGADYLFTYADGLNRFYIAKEHTDLVNQFKYPPNVFDDFLLAHQHIAIIQSHKAIAQAEHAESQAHQLLIQLNSIHSSQSWRLTKPLRWAEQQIRAIRNQGLKARVFALCKRLSLFGARFVVSVMDRFPRLRQPVVKLIKRLGFYKFFHSCHIRITGHATTASRYSYEYDLNSNAEQIYKELKAAIKIRGD